MLSGLLLSAVLAQGFYTPAEAKAVFTQANEAYAREDFAQASSGFSKLLEHGFGGADVLYNLGTSALAEGKLGEAVLYLERARRAGGDPDIEANLAVARSRQLDRVVGAQADEQFLTRLASATRESLTSTLFLVFGWGALALWAWGRFSKKPRSFARAGAGVLVLLALGSGGLTAAHAWVANNLVESVVLAPLLKARELPRDGSKVAFEVHAGLKVRVLGEEGRFVRIRLPNGLEGWTEKDGVAQI